MNASEIFIFQIFIFGEESPRSFHKAIVPRVSFLAQKNFKNSAALVIRAFVYIEVKFGMESSSCLF